MIGLLNDCFPPIMDGVAVATSNYAYWLQKKNGNVCVITPQVPNSLLYNYEYPVFRYFSLPVPKRKPYRMGLPGIDYAFWKKIGKIPFELLHAHCPFSSGVIARRIARAQHVPIVATFHSKYKADFMRVVHNKYIVELLIKNVVSFYEQADEVWIPQPAVEETLREYGFRGRVEVVENGNDFAGRPYSVAQKIRSRRLLGLDEKVPILLFVGQHIWEKNVGFILCSLSKLSHLDFKMIFIGTGYAAADMKQMARDLGLVNEGKEKVLFIGSVSERERLSKYYEAADLFLFPSLYDNAPLVVREAAALHTPSLLLRGSTAAEIISHKKNGFLCEADESAYAVMIEQILSDQTLLSAVGNGAADTLARSWEDIAEEVSDRYLRLIRKYKSLYA